jgi:hypothetical protein
MYRSLMSTSGSTLVTRTYLVITRARQAQATNLPRPLVGSRADGQAIGIRLPASIFPTFAGMAKGFALMAEVVGGDHVALGTDIHAAPAFCA